MIASGIQTLNTPEIPADNNTTQDQSSDFSNYLDEMKNRGMAHLQLTVLPGGELLEVMEEVKNIKFDLKNLPSEVAKKEEDNILLFKNINLEDVKVGKKNARLESNDLFLSQREVAKTAGKNQGINNFNKIYNIKKESKSEAANEEARILSMIENKSDLGELKSSEVPKENKVQFSDNKQLFNWISKIIAKNSIPKGQALNLAIKDGALGQFNIIAQNVGEGGQLKLEILAQSKAGKNFFSENEENLMKSLEKAGLKVSEFRVQLAGSNNSLNNDMATLMRDSREAVAERLEENMFQREDLDQDSRRRHRIWEEALEQKMRGA